MSISPENYIRWVQRSLNRLLDAKLASDGKITPEYRHFMKEFQFAYGLRETGDVDVPDQDALIKANHIDPIYVYWVQEALRALGQSPSSSGKTDSATKNALEAFQKTKPLSVDGWVGSKTELALIETSGIRPPGERRTPPPRPKPRPKPTPPPKPPPPLTPDQALDRRIGAMYWELIHNPGLYPNKEQRKRLSCLLGKLKKKTGIDDKYLRSQEARSFAFGGQYAYEKGFTPEELSWSVRKRLKTWLKQNQERYDAAEIKEKFKQEVLYLYYDIERGLGEIAGIYGVHGDSSNAAKVLNKWGMDKQAKSHAILSCFK